MNATFLVQVDIEDVSSLATAAEQVKVELEDAGIRVISVRPWARPSSDTPNINQITTT